MYKRQCPNCKHKGYVKGRAFDGRRVYRCQQCQTIWSEGMQGRKKTYNKQSYGYQFANTGVIK